MQRTWQESVLIKVQERPAHRPQKAGMGRAGGHSALRGVGPGGALSRYRWGPDGHAGRGHALQLEPEGPQVCVRPQPGPIQALQWVSSLRPKAIRIKPMGSLRGPQRPRVICSCLPCPSWVPVNVSGSQASKGWTPTRHHPARVAHHGDSAESGHADPPKASAPTSRPASWFTFSLKHHGSQKCSC